MKLNLQDLVLSVKFVLSIDSLLLHALLLLLYFLVTLLMLNFRLHLLCLILTPFLINSLADLLESFVLLLLQKNLFASCFLLPLQEAHPVLHNLNVLLSLFPNLSMLQHFDTFFDQVLLVVGYLRGHPFLAAGLTATASTSVRLIGNLGPGCMILRLLIL